MKISARRGRYAATGSPRWWRRLALNVSLRLAALIWLLWELASGGASGAYLALGIAVALMMTFTLAFPVAACVIAIRNPEWLDASTPD